jgi:hypothetical protein
MDSSALKSRPLGILDLTSLVEVHEYPKICISVELGKGNARIDGVNLHKILRLMIEKCLEHARLESTWQHMLLNKLLVHISNSVFILQYTTDFYIYCLLIDQQGSRSCWMSHLMLSATTYRFL